jgi:hypothetical protein
MRGLGLVVLMEMEKRCSLGKNIPYFLHSNFTPWIMASFITYTKILRISSPDLYFQWSAISIVISYLSKMDSLFHTEFIFLLNTNFEAQSSKTHLRRYSGSNPVILATQEAEIRRMAVRSQPQANNSQDPISEKKKKKKVDGVT